MNPNWDCFLRAREGDENAWRELVDKYQSRLTALAMLISKSADSSADIVQETFVRAFRATISNTTGSVGGYLGTIAYRLALKESRRAKRDVALAEHDRVDDNLDPLQQLLKGERDKMIARAIGRLDDDHRQVLVLRCYGGHSYEEISQLMNIPLGTVKSRIFYAVKTCREHLQDKGIL